MHPEDTIAAISSAVGPAARMIVRASGAAAIGLARGVAESVPGEGGRAERTRLRFAGLTVPGCWVYVFHAPRSYTGEDLVEFHLPGNPVLARLLLDALTAGGARQAGPGEFTARAYFNGRLDLAEAEGVAATIAANNEQELAAARQLMAGELARRLRPALDAVAETLALVEVGIDFVDEDVTVLSAAETAARIAAADSLLRELAEESHRFERLTHEPEFVLVGRPNAGKSTLLNALAGFDRAVTSPVAGTTRDVLTAEVALRRGIVRVTDVAGLDEGENPGPEDPAWASTESSPPVGLHDHAVESINRQMRERALRAVAAADHVILVRDPLDPAPPPTGRDPDLAVWTKSDLGTTPSSDPLGGAGLSVSAITGSGLDQLRAAMDAIAFGAPAARPTLALNARHLRLIAEARSALTRAAARAGGPAELLALDLREALDALGGVLGHVSPDELLGRIFSAFCIGK